MLASALMALFRAPERQLWWAAYPVELFAGWLTAASSVSIGLIGAGFGMGPGQVGWALVSLGIALALALWVIRRRYAPAYATGVIWALIAVAVGNAGREWSVASAAAIGAVLIGVATFYSRRSEAARR